MNPEPAPLTPEDLLEHAEFLQNLAKKLVWGDAEADDMVQEAWLRAIVKPPKSIDPKAWFSRVVQNLTIKANRSAQRRAKHEQKVVNPELTRSAFEITVWQEQQIVISTAVRSLPEDLRLVIHLRYHEGYGVQKIARRLEAPLDTIKSRLKRALGLLRQKLDKEHDGDRRAWCLVLVPFAGGAGKGLTASTVLVSTGFLGGAMAVATKKTSIIIATLVILASTTILLMGGKDDSLSPKSNSAPQPLQSTLASRAGEITEEPDLPRKSIADNEIGVSSPSPGSMGAELEVEVFWLAEGVEKGAAGARIEVVSILQDEHLFFQSNAGDGQDEEVHSLSKREFRCDSVGNVSLPLETMSGSVGRTGATFHIQAEMRDRQYYSGRQVVRLDQHGRFGGNFQGGYIRSLKKLRIQVFPRQALTIFVHDENDRGVQGVPIQLYNPIWGLSTASSKKVVNPRTIAYLPLKWTGEDGKCTFTFPLTKYFRNVKHLCYAGFAFPLGNHARWFKRVGN